MFFALSKILIFLIKPLILIGILAVYALYTKSPLRRRKALIALVMGYLVFTNLWIVSTCANVWETGRMRPQDIQQPYEVGILLGGYADFTVDAPDGILSLQRSNRLTTALELFKTGKIKRLLLSGGSGLLLGKESVESEVVRDYLREVGVPDSAILIDNKSRNTYENAVYSKAIIESLPPGTTCLLITSAWHMRRAEGCFNKVGLDCQSFGTDYFSVKVNGNFLRWIEPDWEALMKWEIMLKEWIGWVAYKGKGYL